MTTSDGLPGNQLGPGSKVGIVAGGGDLPVSVAAHLKGRGHSPFVVLLEGEADQSGPLGEYAHDTILLESIGNLVPILKRQDVTHIVLAGEVKRRPKLSAIRWNAGLLAMLPSIALGLSRGDDALLRVVLRYFERQGMKVIGAHELVPDLLASEGCLTEAGPLKADWRDIEAARIAAEAIGALDIGQGAVAIGGRTIALEGIEGTDGLLARVRDLRTHGRLAGKPRGVLVKCSKPGQEERTDLPSIGPQTIDGAHAAGLAGIAVEAGRSLVLNGPELVRRANEAGVFVIGLPARTSAHDA
jgi:DUF1009 family protein